MTSRGFLTMILALGLAAGALRAQGICELEGNAVQDAGPPMEDWETLYDSGANTGGTSIAFTGILPDPGNTTIFVGGRKDIQDISQWGWKNDGGFPDKNDITNAYAAAYTDPISEDLLLYFGADRYSNTGDAFMGFWFFQDLVTLNANGDFNGQHVVGDILILMNYPQGSPEQPEVQVLEWNPALADVAPNLRFIAGGVGALCGAVPPQDWCAVTNAVDAISPWPYAPKSGSSGTFPPESFFEGGINLAQTLGENICFSSFMAETRSSTSLTATLKDFVLGEFPVCGISVEKTCDVVSVNAGGDLHVTFSGNVTNTGGGTFPAGAIVTVVDNAGTPGDVGDDVVIQEALLADLGPGDQHAFSGSFDSDYNPPMNTVTASISFGSNLVEADPFMIECTPVVLNPALDINKSCSLALETVGSYLVVRVDFTGDVTNTGDVPLNVTVTDQTVGVVLGPIVMQPNDQETFSGSYYPMQASGGETDPNLAAFGGSVTASGTNPLLGGPVQVMNTANCTLCDQ